jgi:hypothetical protein
MIVMLAVALLVLALITANIALSGVLLGAQMERSVRRWSPFVEEMAGRRRIS